jgi:leucyl aminopeptidase (aminopeptidase T)
VAPEPTRDPQLAEAIETMLASNGSYQAGDRAVIHVRPAALEMGCATAHVLRERGIEATVVLGMLSLGAELVELIDLAARAAETTTTLPAGGDSGAGRDAARRTGPGAGRDFGAVDPAVLDGVTACYREMLAPIETAGRGHWIVPIGTAPDPDPAHVPAIDLFQKVAGRALAPIGMMRNDGRIVSHDIWLSPSPLDVARLNEDLPAARHWTLDEWRSLVFRSMAVSSEELHRAAMAIEGVALTVHASVHGGRLHYAREDGTDFSYEVRERPVILDCGSIGVNSLGKTTPYRSAITNQPTTEVFVAPIEDSLTGVIVYPIPERTVHGVIRAPYRIEVRDGRVTGIEAPDDESRRILRHYTGLEPFDGKALGGDAAEAFALRRVIAEMAIAGFNPVMLPEIKNGRLRPVTGLVLLDEKVGDHQAFGSNDQFMGRVPSAISNEPVEHTDFVGGIERVVRVR